MKRYKMGARGHPCRTPASNFIDLDIMDFILTWAVVSADRRVLTMSMNGCGSPSLRSTWSRKFLLMVSYAFWKSQEIRYHSAPVWNRRRGRHRCPGAGAHQRIRGAILWCSTSYKRFVGSRAIVTQINYTTMVVQSEILVTQIIKLLYLHQIAVFVMI